MKNILTVMKKEFARFFGDRRMIVSILMSAVLIYVVYSFIGSAAVRLFAPDEYHIPIVYVVNMPDSIGQIAEAEGISVRNIGEREISEVKEKITQKEADICVIFPLGFDIEVEAYDARTSAEPAPDIEIFFNSVNPNSRETHRLFSALLDEYETSLSNKFDINRGNVFADLATNEEISASIISSILPMLLLLFLYSGCISLAPESIAGEKERGTLATLLVTPLKRSELAIGKMLSLAALSLLSGSAMAVAMILALPNLTGRGEERIGTDIYGASDIVLLVLVMLSTMLLFVAIISVLSAFAKTVKEAYTYVSPLMVLVMLTAITGMFSGGAGSAPVYYIIPLYNSVQSMSGIFGFNYSVMNIALACLSNFLYACIGGFILTKMFNSERTMFSR